MTREVGWLLKDVELIDGRRLDVRLSGGRVSDLGALTRLPGEPVMEAAGAALSVGLADHHLHLLAMAAAAASLDLSLRRAPDRSALETVLAGAMPDSTGWIRAVGYAEQAGAAELELLDRLHPTTPLRIQHRSGALWILNSAGLAAAGITDASEGRLWRSDGWLAARLPPGPPPDLGRVGRELAGYGITAVTDATPDLPPRSQQLLSDAVEDGRLPQRVMLLGAAAPVHPRILLGPRKILLSDHELPAFDDVGEQVLTARAERRAVAIHCVTRAALALTIAVLDELGTVRGDRIEHASLVDQGGISELRRLGVAVVTQPGFIADRGDDYPRDLPAEDIEDLYRCESLRLGGVTVACSSDAPYGPVDPWAVVRAAAERRTPSGRVLGASERTPVRQALQGYLSAPSDPGGPSRRIEVGAAADLVLLHAPWAAVVAEPGSDLVRCTFYGGQVHE